MTPISLFAGIVSGIILFAIGIALGMRIARRRSLDSGEILSQTDREQMLLLLQQLGAWTSEYSGSVSDYQSELGKLQAIVEKEGSAPNSKVMLVLQQIMTNNEQLQSRLEAAERQLDKQTQQIECYLTEARTDGLTNLFNRRAFDQRLDEVFDAYKSGEKSFVMVLIDIDKFKLINDNHGHQAGDEVLKQVAAILRSQLSGATIVARFGGEEFSAILEGPLRVAAAKMNEVRQAIADQKMDAGDAALNVSISIGLSEPREDIVSSPIVRRADEALYAAKNTGRNRVYFHDGKAPTLVGAPELSPTESTS